MRRAGTPHSPRLRCDRLQCRRSRETRPFARCPVTNIPVVLRSALAADAQSAARIYNYYVQNTVITFEEEPLSVQSMATRIADIQSQSLPCLVAEVENVTVGYAYATQWKARTAYRFSVETTIYLEHGRQG